MQLLSLAVQRGNAKYRRSALVISHEQGFCFDGGLLCGASVDVMMEHAYVAGDWLCWLRSGRQVAWGFCQRWYFEKAHGLPLHVCCSSTLWLHPLTLL